MADPWYTLRTFWCPQCGFKEERKLNSFGQEEICPKCDLVLDMEDIRTPELMHTSVQHAEYNPAFGKVIRSRQERQELAKRKGLVEIGNQPLDSLITETAKNIRRRSYDE